MVSVKIEMNSIDCSTISLPYHALKSRHWAAFSSFLHSSLSRLRLLASINKAEPMYSIRLFFGLTAR